jgi:hypothetical protein
VALTMQQATPLTICMASRNACSVAFDRCDMRRYEGW